MPLFYVLNIVSVKNVISGFENHNCKNRNLLECVFLRVLISYRSPKRTLLSKCLDMCALFFVTKFDFGCVFSCQMIRRYSGRADMVHFNLLFWISWYVVLE